MIYLNGESEVRINFNDINSITRYQGSRFPRPFEPHVIPSNFYHHTTIESKTGDLITFSDFVCAETGIYQTNKLLIVRPLLNLIANKSR